MQRYRITHPQPGWTGQIGVVAFAGGTAEVAAEDDDVAPLQYFRANGYLIEDLGPADVAGRDVAGRIAELEAERTALRAQLDADRSEQPA